MPFYLSLSFSELCSLSLSLLFTLSICLLSFPPSLSLSLFPQLLFSNQNNRSEVSHSGISSQSKHQIKASNHSITSPYPYHTLLFLSLFRWSIKSEQLGTKKKESFCLPSSHHVIFFSCLFSGPPLPSSLRATLLRPLQLL